MPALSQRLRQRVPLPLAQTLATGVAWATTSWLAAAVVRTGGPTWDNPLLNYWHRHATPALDKLAIFFTITGNTWPMVGTGLAVAALLLARRQRREAWVFALSVGGSMLLTQVLKRLVARPRPSLWASIRPEHTFSFPSGHAMDTAAIAAALGFLAWRYRAHRLTWALAPLFALGVGWARVYLGVHHPSDVLAGWSAALGWVLLVQGMAAQPRPLYLS